VAKLSDFLIHFLFGGLIVLFVVLASFSTEILETFQMEDVHNLTSMIFELGMGLVITLVVYYYSKRNEKQHKAVLDEIIKKLEKL